MDAGRAAAVAALRERLARLGGVRSAAVRSGLPWSPPSHGEAEPVVGLGRALVDPGVGEALGRLGFVIERQAAGMAWVRRVAIDLEPFLDRAGSPAPVSGHQLVQLAAPGAEVGGALVEAGDCAVLDIETLGLRGSGVVPFLVGIGTPHGSVLDIDQLLLVDRDAEAALLGAALARLGRRRLLVTYNGRTFDLPVLRSRCVMERVSGGDLDAAWHCDLLHPVRRLFRDRLGACTLRQAELSLLGFEREDDVPGWEAPERYRRFLHHGDVRALAGVVRHNQLDLCATMVLAARLAAHVEGRLVQPVHPGDRYHLAVHLERSGGVAENVEGHYRATLSRQVGPWDRQAGHRLARRLARGTPADRDEAVRVLRRLVVADPGDLRAARALCVLQERGRDLEGALHAAAAALEACHRLGPFRLARLRAAPSGGWAADWERRHARLSLRLARQRSRHGSARRVGLPLETPIRGVGVGAMPG